MSNHKSPVLYLIACGGYVAGELDGFIRTLQADGWEICVVATPSALRFMDTSRLKELTGHVVRSDYKRPDEPDILPKADAMAVVPATFNTINKWVSGISDTLALGILNEAVGLRLPIVAAPTVNAALAKHPAFAASVATLRSWGVRVLFDREKYPPPEPGTGVRASDFFRWQELEAAVREMQVAVE